MNRVRTGVLLATIFLAFSAGVLPKYIGFSPPSIFHKFDPRISALYALVYMPEYPIEVNNREKGTVDTVPISELLTLSSLDVPYSQSNDSFRVFTRLRFQCDTAYLRSLGLTVRGYWNHNAWAGIPLSLVPTLDTMSCIMGTEIEINAPMMGVKIPVEEYEIIGSDTCLNNLAGNSFLIIVKDSSIIGLGKLKKDLQELFKCINASFALCCRGRLNGQPISLDSLRHMNVLHGKEDYPVLFFNYSGKWSGPEEVFADFLAENPQWNDLIEMHSPARP